MFDLMYVVIAIAFFAFMLAYVRGAEAIAQKPEDGAEPKP